MSTSALPPRLQSALRLFAPPPTDPAPRLGHDPRLLRAVADRERCRRTRRPAAEQQGAEPDRD